LFKVYFKYFYNFLNLFFKNQKIKTPIAGEVMVIEGVAVESPIKNERKDNTYSNL